MDTTRASSQFPFLSRYTSVRTQTPRDFAQALDINTETNEPAYSIDFVEPQPDIDMYHPFPMLAPLYLAEPFQSDDPMSFPGLLHDTVVDRNTEFRREDVAVRRTAELLVLFEGTQAVEFCSSRSDILTLLTPDYLAKTVELFFRQAHRHVPFVYEPAFDMATVEISLLLAIFMVGCVWTYPRDTYYFFLTLDIIKVAEECIFGHKVFQKLLHRDGVDIGLALPITQAATLLVSISFGFPDIEVRRRFRSHRFSDLVSVTRTLRSKDTEFSTYPVVKSVRPLHGVEYITRESYNR